MKKNVVNNPLSFEDALYILNERIQILRDSLSLDLSPDLFYEKNLDDMDFIEKTLDILLKRLLEGTQILDRDEQLDNLSETEWQFSQVLTKFMSINNEMYHSSSSRDKFSALRSRSATRRKTAEDAQTKTEKMNGAPIVSEDEMSELLKKF
ncbi:MAG: hypothetical protein LBL06_01510 [Treponema sp.]|jgi:hypothetical protein|nr:hypothetical protein [Treponema sp.]